MTLMLKIVGLKAYQRWMRIPPAQRKAILRAAQSWVKKHGPTVARTVRDRGPSSRSGSAKRSASHAEAAATAEALVEPPSSRRGSREVVSCS